MNGKFYAEAYSIDLNRADEVLRLKQITGLAELFENEDFDEAWEPEE